MLGSMDVPGLGVSILKYNVTMVCLSLSSVHGSTVGLLDAYE